jgi:hypothetical protein
MRRLFRGWEFSARRGLRGLDHRDVRQAAPREAFILSSTAAGGRDRPSARLDSEPRRGLQRYAARSGRDPSR